MPALYHYTTGQKWKLIDADGVIKLCDGPLQMQKKERPVAWFSTNPVYEPSAIKFAADSRGRQTRLTYEQMHQLADGTYRISIELAAAPHNYAAFIVKSGIPLDEARYLAEVGIHWGADPNHWFVSFEPVPRTRWLSVERDDTGRGGWTQIWARPNGDKPETPSANSFEVLYTATIGPRPQVYELGVEQRERVYQGQLRCDGRHVAYAPLEHAGRERALVDVEAFLPKIEYDLRCSFTTTRRQT
jgi:hypothetical protein